ncbi:MAG: hypothetical protein QOD09_2134 [Bradyrhizobium sp.]|jgi:hypothetical protein|nr:hypothetical protein [Bradyrhizobium sp.]MEA2953636.1 hypothetical protein [Alphaproteobacteria bacterium]
MRDRLRALHGVTRVVVCLILSLFAAAAGAAEGRYSAVDRAIRETAADIEKPRFNEDVTRVEGLLRQIIAAATPETQIKDRDISSRLALLDGLKQARAAATSGQTLIAIRKLVDCLNLVVVLQRLQDSHGAEGSDQLAALQKFLWDDLTVRGNGATLPGAQVLSAEATGTLLHRQFFLDDGTVLAFELVGDPKWYDAQWVETRFKRASASVMTVLDELLPPNEKAGRRAYPWRFALLAIPKNEAESGEFETALSDQTSRLAAQAIAPVIAESADQKRPTMKVPAIRLPPQVGNRCAGSLSLIEFGSRAEICLLPSAAGANPRAVKSAISSALGVASELARTFAAPPLARADELALPFPVFTDSAEEKPYAPRRALQAWDIQTKAAVDVTAADVINLRGTTNTGWGKFSVARLPATIWLFMANATPVEGTPPAERDDDQGKKPQPVKKPQPEGIPKKR